MEHEVVQISPEMVRDDQARDVNLVALNRYTVLGWCKSDCSIALLNFAIWYWNRRLRDSLKLILLQLHENSLKNSTSTMLQSFGIWNKLERWKSLICVCLVSWQKIKKSSFWSVVFAYSIQQQWIISWSDCDVQKWIVPRSSGWTYKKLQSTSQSQTSTKRSVTV